jgi:hypothetical protein
MSFDAVAEIARAVLYEGYLLYPYRPTALKNRQRWMFGRLLPCEYSLANGNTDPWRMQAECLVLGSPQTRVEISVRFLQLMDHQNELDATALGTTIERDFSIAVTLNELVDAPLPASLEFEPYLQAKVIVSALETGGSAFKLSIVIENRTPALAENDLDRTLSRALLSTHILLAVGDGEFVSLVDPPEAFRVAAASCSNIGTWPVLVGPELGKMMLCAPIILYDYPQVAPESPGDLFDNTEIDELLSLRIQTLSAAEKQQMIAASEHGRSVLERTESLTEEQLLQLHGRLQCVSPIRQAGEAPDGKKSSTQNVIFKRGDRVRLQPSRSADAIDFLLAGQTATIVSIEQDFEDVIHLGVVVDEDPGRDFGINGRPGHRFFYRPDEVELLSTP